MSEARVFVRTHLGQSQLDRLNGNLSEDEKQLMCLVNGINTIADLRKKAPTMVRDDLSGLLRQLLHNGYIIDAKQLSYDQKVFIRTGLGNKTLEQSDGNMPEVETYLLSLLDGQFNVEGARIKLAELFPHDISDLISKLLIRDLIVEKQQNDLKEKNEHVIRHATASQTLHLDMLLLAEVEVGRRMEAEQALNDLQGKFEQSQLALKEISLRCEDMHTKFSQYKAAVEAKILEQQTQIVAISDQNQGDRTLRMKLNADLVTLRKDNDIMNRQSVEMAEAVQHNLLLARSAMDAERRKSKVDAEERIRSHPQYARLRGLNFFKRFRNSDLDELFTWAEWVNVGARETIMTEGEVGLPFYVVVSGRLTAVKKNHTVMFLRAGDSFGETAYFDDSNPEREISVIAQSDCELLKLEPIYLENAELMLRMSIAEALVRSQAKRTRHTMNVVVRMLD